MDIGTFFFPLAGKSDFLDLGICCGPTYISTYFNLEHWKQL